MHLNAQKPIFVPSEFMAEIETMSKAALMDMVWDLSQSCSGQEGSAEETMQVLRARRDTILLHRKRALLKRVRDSRSLISNDEKGVA